MRTISIFTPTHTTKRILRAHNSVIKQLPLRHGWQWEWVICPNGEVTENNLYDLFGTIDARIRVVPMPFPFTNIGTAKKFCCEQCKGEILVELDHDDELSPNCLQEVVEAFIAHPNAGMFYSNCTTIQESGILHAFNKDQGWVYDIDSDGDLVPRSPQPLPQNIARGGFSPDHVRAYRADVYRKVGGHDSVLTLADDIDLTCNIYASYDIAYIPKKLYRYHLHDTNTWTQKLDVVQNEMVLVYREWIDKLIQAYSTRNQLPIYNIHPTKKMLGWKFLSNFDLNQPWPFEENSVFAYRTDRIPKIAVHHAWKTLVPGGMLLIEMEPVDIDGAIFAFKDIFQPIFVEQSDEKRILHFAALKPGYHPYLNWSPVLPAPNEKPV